MKVVQDAVHRALSPVSRIVLAVSGGLDSMALLDAAAVVIAPDRLVVATFDHATGDHSRRAMTLVCRRARALGLQVISGRSGQGHALRAEGMRPSAPEPTEALWRERRWEFLRRVGRRVEGTIATAHTRDDQVETVLMRIMRGAGARGIAGLYAATSVVRPVLDVSRHMLMGYADSRRLRWIEDPSNASRDHLRNRVRLDLLPALRCVDPAIEATLLDLAARAARWRAEVEEFVDRNVLYSVVGMGGALDVARGSLAGYSRESLAILWAALAGQVGLALDWRGTRRLVEFTMNGRPGSRIQLSGGWETILRDGSFLLRRSKRGPIGDEQGGGRLKHALTHRCELDAG